MNQSPKDFDDDRIAHNRKARGAPPRNFCGGGNGGNGGRGSGDGGGSGCGSNYGQGNISSPAKNKTARVVNGKAYAT